MKVVVLPPNGEAKVEDIDKSNGQFIHDAVGGFFETRLIDHGIMWMNEDGRRLRLPLNVLATMMAGGINIVGTVVLTGLPDRHGDFTEVPQDIIDALAFTMDKSPD